MDLQKFEDMILIAKRHSVERFSYNGVSVTLMPSIPDFPVPESNTEDEDPVFHSEKDPLLNNPMMR